MTDGHVDAPSGVSMSSPFQQLDIFSDSREVALRNAVFDALQRRDAAEARAAWLALRTECPHDASLADFDRLALALEIVSTAALSDHGAAAEERATLTGAVTPAAQRVFGAQAGEAWIQPMWAALAARCARLRFDASHAEDHAAALWLRAGQWEQAQQAIEGIESWRRIPAPLAWMTQARLRLSGLDASWPLLAELAWLSPGRFDETARGIGDPLLNRLRKAFGISFEGTDDVADLAWFPAWVLTEVPALAPQLALAQPSLHTPPEQALRLLVDILGLERQGRQHDLLLRRRMLRDLNASLFRAYMASR